ncbi:hypothetical protein [Embleya scabrispora]|uniref:hypothetical protein n=1 Tax=Embleya scabrispora TaxID=159449 RepID=UPI000365894A|nr:hypothetical protein [Embleya scabrispora]MYS83032.1 hypothetical protein [Streptomyces sp. SID5474]
MSDVLQQTTTELYLRLSDCTMRVGKGSRGRPALEVYAGYRLIDVAVAGAALGPTLLRGALRSGRGEPAWALAWGVLPDDGVPPQVEFRRGRFMLQAPATIFGERFWVSTVPGTYRSLTVSTECDARGEGGRLTRMRAPRL